MRDTGHLAGQRECIGREFEEWIRDGLDGMKPYAVVVYSSEAERHFIRYEMDGVSSFGQCYAEFGSDDTASARRWITCDAYAHKIVPTVTCFPYRYRGCMTGPYTILSSATITSSIEVCAGNGCTGEWTWK